MALKKVKNEEVNITEESLALEISYMESKIHKLTEEMKLKRQQLLNLKIKPFKVGGYALVQVPSGKTSKEQKCLLECDEWGTLYVRPIKADGELSGRHFSIIPIGNTSYVDLLKEVK